MLPLTHCSFWIGLHMWIAVERRHWQVHWIFQSSLRSRHKRPRQPALTIFRSSVQLHGYKMKSKDWDRDISNVAVHRTCALFVACLGETVASHLVVFNQVCCYLAGTIHADHEFTNLFPRWPVSDGSLCMQTAPSAHFFLVSSGPATKGWDWAAVHAFMDCEHKSHV